MSSSKPTTPSFVFGYWRPWNEKANLFDSYLDYSRDLSLTKYGSDTIGTYINLASKDHLRAVDKLARSISRGVDEITGQLGDISESLLDISDSLSGISRVMGYIAGQLDQIDSQLSFLNRNLDIQIEQQRVGNLILRNIAELLRVSDSEKERQHNIELGLKFYVNAKNDPDLFSDALDELLQAEVQMKQDYFVLHRIACIYLYATKLIDPAKARDYFLRAAKYASVESDPEAIRLANALTENFSAINTDINKSTSAIGLLTADSYEKAAFACYVLGQFEDAVTHQRKALNYNSSPRYMFQLAKYQARLQQVDEVVANLDKAIEAAPELVFAAMSEIDLLNEVEVLKLIQRKDDSVNEILKEILQDCRSINSIQADEIAKQIPSVLLDAYDGKVNAAKSFRQTLEELREIIESKETEIDRLVSAIGESRYAPADASDGSSLVEDLRKAKTASLEQMETVLIESKKNHSRFVRRGKEYIDLCADIERLAYVIRTSTFANLTEHEQQKLELFAEIGLDAAKELPILESRQIYDKVARLVESNKVEIGSAYGGGIVFHIDDTGKHGLIMSSGAVNRRTEMKIYVKVGAGAYVTVSPETAPWGECVLVGTGDKVGDGPLNTALILERASWSEEKKLFRNTKVPLETASRVAIESNLGGFSDWFIPSLGEARLAAENERKYSLFDKLGLLSRFWTSTEVDTNDAYLWDNDKAVAVFKGIEASAWTKPVRLVRRF